MVRRDAAAKNAGRELSLPETVAVVTSLPYGTLLMELHIMVCQHKRHQTHYVLRTLWSLETPYEVNCGKSFGKKLVAAGFQCSGYFALDGL